MAVLENLALKSLPLEPRRNLTLLVHHRQFPAGETLFASGSTIPKLFFLNSGAVSLATPLTGGETIQFAIVGREGLIGGAAALEQPVAFTKSAFRSKEKAIHWTLMSLLSWRRTTQNCAR